MTREVVGEAAAGDMPRTLAGASRRPGGVGLPDDTMLTRSRGGC